MARYVFRLVLLPVDVFRLTIDFFRLTEWHVARALAGMVGVVGPSSGPFCVRRGRSIDSEGEPCSICMHAQCYMNPMLFGMLCRWVRVEPVTGGSLGCVCRRRRSYRAPVMRYAWVGVALGLIWASAWLGMVHWLAGR